MKLVVEINEFICWLFIINLVGSICHILGLGYIIEIKRFKEASF